jgi:hypothetical protein
MCGSDAESSNVICIRCEINVFITVYMDASLKCHKKTTTKNHEFIIKIGFICKKVCFRSIENHGFIM